MTTHRGIVLTTNDFVDFDYLSLIKKSGLTTVGLHSGGGANVGVLKHLGMLRTNEFRKQIADSGLEWEYELHACEELLSRKLFSDNPDWFVMDVRRGKRNPHGNWCVSSPGVLEMVAENALLLARTLPPSTHRYFYWGADRASGDWCHCPQCRHLTPADQNLMTVNAIARRLRQEDPRAQIGFLAYHSTFAAPSAVKPERNVILEFAPYHRCFQHRLTDTSCAVNRQIHKVLLDLLAVFPAETAHVLEYFIDSSLFGFQQHPPEKVIFQADVVDADIGFYVQCGIRSITSFGVRMNKEYFAAYSQDDFLKYAEILNRHLP